MTARRHGGGCLRKFGPPSTVLDRFWCSDRQPVAPTFSGLPVLGSYGSGLLIATNHVPSGYVAVVATAGPGNMNNIVGTREHQNPAYRGLRAIPGNRNIFPIIESFSARTVGAGMAIQVMTDASYTAPDKTAWSVIGAFGLGIQGNSLRENGYDDANPHSAF